MSTVFRRVQCDSADAVPEDAVFVGRPSRWGNPFQGGETAIIAGRAVEVRDRGHAQVLFIAHLALRPDLVAAARRELVGKNLACPCPLYMTCHASVWLRKVA